MACDRRTRVSLWQSAAERAGAVDGVLHVGGAARLRDATEATLVGPGAEARVFS